MRDSNASQGDDSVRLPPIHKLVSDIQPTSQVLTHLRNPEEDAAAARDSPRKISQSEATSADPARADPTTAATGSSTTPTTTSGDFTRNQSNNSAPANISQSLPPSANSTEHSSAGTANYQPGAAGEASGMLPMTYEHHNMKGLKLEDQEEYAAARANGAHGAYHRDMTGYPNLSHPQNARASHGENAPYEVSHKRKEFDGKHTAGGAGANGNTGASNGSGAMSHTQSHQPASAMKASNGVGADGSAVVGSTDATVGECHAAKEDIDSTGSSRSSSSNSGNQTTSNDSNSSPDDSSPSKSSSSSNLPANEGDGTMNPHKSSIALQKSAISGRPRSDPMYNEFGPKGRNPILSYTGSDEEHDSEDRGVRNFDGTNPKRLKTESDSSTGNSGSNSASSSSPDSASSNRNSDASNGRDEETSASASGTSAMAAPGTDVTRQPSAVGSSAKSSAPSDIEHGSDYRQSSHPSSHSTHSSTHPTQVVAEPNATVHAQAAPPPAAANQPTSAPQDDLSQHKPPPPQQQHYQHPQQASHHTTGDSIPAPVNASEHNLPRTVSPRLSTVSNGSQIAPQLAADLGSNTASPKVSGGKHFQANGQVGSNSSSNTSTGNGAGHGGGVPPEAATVLGRPGDASNARGGRLSDLSALKPLEPTPNSNDIKFSQIPVYSFMRAGPMQQEGKSSLPQLPMWNHNGSNSLKAPSSKVREGASESRGSLPQPLQPKTSIHIHPQQSGTAQLQPPSAQSAPTTQQSAPHIAQQPQEPQQPQQLQQPQQTQQQQQPQQQPQPQPQQPQPTSMHPSQQSQNPTPLAGQQPSQPQQQGQQQQPVGNGMNMGTPMYSPSMHAAGPHNQFYFSFPSQYQHMMQFPGYQSTYNQAMQPGYMATPGMNPAYYAMSQYQPHYPNGMVKSMPEMPQVNSGPMGAAMNGVHAMNGVNGMNGMQGMSMMNGMNGMNGLSGIAAGLNGSMQGYDGRNGIKLEPEHGTSESPRPMFHNGQARLNFDNKSGKPNQHPEFHIIDSNTGRHLVAEMPRRRGNLPKDVTNVLRSWLTSHLGHPYPTEDEKMRLVEQTGLSLVQVSNWFINARRRSIPASQRRGRLHGIRGDPNEDPQTQ